MSFWNQTSSDIVSALLPIIVGALVYALRFAITWLRSQKNAVLHTIGELAYTEVESNFSGTAGAQKMTIAIEKLRSRLGNAKWAKDVTDDQIIKVLQKAWYTQEGQYKSATTENAKAEPDKAVPIEPNVSEQGVGDEQVKLLEELRNEQMKLLEELRNEQKKISDEILKKQLAESGGGYTISGNAESNLNNIVTNPTPTSWLAPSEKEEAK